MRELYCQGCGAKIQSTDPEKFGYVPEHLLEEGGSIICQRCYRIIHYGRHELGAVQADQALQSIAHGLDWAQGVVLVVDILDFESGLPPEFIRLLQGRELLVAVNKVDLLPPQTPLDEVERWARRRLKDLGLPGVEVCLISAVTGWGFPALADRVEGLGSRVLFVGVTNVGKSSVLERLLRMRIGGGQRRGIKPTISPYPGTTVSVSQWHCPGITLGDSPGLVPRGRISDLVGAEQAVKIIPHKSISSHLYPVGPGDLVLIAGLCVVECLEAGEGGLLLGFTGSGVHWHKSSLKHLEKWLQRDSAFARWEQRPVYLRPGEDLLISGLGWVSARKTPFKLRLHIPVGVKHFIRPNLIGRKK